jgi:hypothetical protein
MPDYHRIVREVSWHDLFPWLLLLRTCRLAAEFRRLFLAAVGIVLTGLGWWAVDALLLSAEDVTQGTTLAVRPETIAILAPPATTHANLPWKETAAAFITHWRLATHPVRQLFARPFTGMTFVASLLAAVWAVFVWGLLGGVICRLSAVQLALDEQLSLRSAVRYVAPKWRSYLAAPLMPLCMAAFFALPLVIAGAVGRADLGLLAVGISWPIVLIFGVLVMLLLVGLALGFPLMWAALSTDGGDSFDAISRSYTYVGQRPLNYLFYTLVSLIIGVLGWLIINTLAAVTLYLTSWGATLGSGEERWQQIELSSQAWTTPFSDTQSAPPYFDANVAATHGPARFGASLIGLWTAGVRLLALAYAYSFFWTAGTGAYLLLRRDAEGKELDEVLVEGADDPAGLPEIGEQQIADRGQGIGDPVD